MGSHMKPVDLSAVIGPLPDEAVSIKPLTVPVKMACQLVGVSNSTMWKLIAEGRVKTISLGRKRLVIYESLEELVLGPKLEKLLVKEKI
jgi:excisionase family DNA binding protein